MKVRTRKLILTRAILANAKAKTARNPLRTDPTRTTGMREHFCRFIDKQFDRLKADVLRAVGKEDWLGVGAVTNCNPSQMRGADGKCGPGIGLDIPREEMPQIRKDDMEDFFKFCKANAVSVTKATASASDLKPTQGEFRQERVDALPDESLKYTVLVSKDNYILDGTHRWIKHWQRDKQSQVPILRVGLPVQQAINLMRKFPKAQFVENVFDPEEMRDPHGQWASGIKVIKDDEKVFRAHFSVNGKLFRFYGKTFSGDRWYVGFDRQTDEGGTSSSGGGDHSEAIAVMTKAAGLLVRVMHAKNPAAVSFDSRRDEASRVRLYDAVTKRISASTGWRLERMEFEKSVKWVLHNPHPVENLYQPFVCNGEVGYFPSRGLIEVPDVRQPDHYSCGAAASMSVGKYLGVGPDTIQEWKDLLGTDVEESTHPSHIVQVMRDLGLQVEAFQHGNLETLDHYLERGWPIICCVQDYGPAVPERARFDYGHYLTVIGHGMGTPGVFGSGYVFCQDSSEDNVVAGGDSKELDKIGSIQKPGRIMVAEEDWVSIWHDKDEQGNPFVRFGIAVGPAVVANEGSIEDKLCVAVQRAYNPSILGPDYQRLWWNPKRRIARWISADGDEDKDVQKVLDAIASVKGLRTVDCMPEGGKPKEFNGWVELDWRPTDNTRWAFATSSGKLAAFGRWLKTRVADLVSGRTMREAWRKYVEAGWRKGAARAFDDTHQRHKWERHPDTVGTDLYRGGREEFLRSSFNHPESVEKVKLLAARTFTDLDGVTTAMSTKMTRTLADGLTMGQHPYQIAASLAKDVDGVGRKRALLVARHNLIYAHAEGQLDNLERLGVEDVGVAVEWTVIPDAKLCPLCEAMEGIVLKTKKAHGLIPRHPNCRCAWLPSFDPPSSPEEIDAAVEAGEMDEEPKGKGLWGIK